MTLRSAAALLACVSTLAIASHTAAWADGMPEPDDQNFNPVPSKPGVPAPGVTQPPPIHDTTPAKPVKPAPAPAAQPKPTPAPAAAQAKPEPQPPAPQPAAPTPPSPPAPAPAAPVSTPPVTPPPPTPTPAVVPAPTSPSSPSVAAQKKTVFEVISVDVTLLERNPPLANVVVKGTARTGGWKNIELRPLQTLAPEVGMRSFTLVGTPPEGPATQSLTPIATTIQINPLPDDVKTIRVLSETNEVAQTFR